MTNKVIFTAFGGRLKSGVMNWHSALPPKIYFPMESSALGQFVAFESIPETIHLKVGIFTPTGFLSDAYDAADRIAVYSLQDIDGAA